MANKTISLEGVEILSNPDPKKSQFVYRNLSGKPTGKYNSTTRFITAKVPEDRVQEFLDMGIDMWSPSSTGENGELLYNVRIDISARQPSGDLNCKVYLVGPNNEPVPMNKDNVGIVDAVNFSVEKVDVLCGVAEKQNNPGHFKLWANVLYIYQGADKDPYAYKFAHNNDDELPFEM